MIAFVTANYSDIYNGPKPTINELLEGISSKIIITLMAMINSELSDNQDDNELQKRLTLWIVQQFPVGEANLIFNRLKVFEQKVNGRIAIWGKRYVLEMMKHEFLNYRNIEKTTNTPEESLKIFKAYLLIVEEVNEKDRKELKEITGELKKGDPHFFEKLVWPVLLKQFDTNNRVDPIAQLFKLFAFIKYSLTNQELLACWKAFITINGFTTLRSYLGSVNFLILLAQFRNPQKDLRVFSWINADDSTLHLKNMVFDRKEFANNPQKQIDFLGMRERPLFQTDPTRFIALDLDYLTNKVYNGPLFDMYKQTGMAKTTSFKSFADFKAHLATEVSEKIIFKGVLKQLFQKKHIRLHFDDDGKDNYPDCYLRSGKKIFLFEFKDYLFPGKIVEQYSFEEIKKHIDLKFIKNEKGKNKGISQITDQIGILAAKRFEFDKFKEKNIKVFPIIVHTNFTYTMPGINYYLNTEFQHLVKQKLNVRGITIEPLILFDLETLIEFLQISNMSVSLLEKFITRYHGILQNREKLFKKMPNQDNFNRSRACFEEVFASTMEGELEYHPIEKRTDIFLSSIDVTDKTFDGF
jgi:hypothetical protein